MTSRHLPRGLDGRSRDQTGREAGEIRQKRADTLVRTLRAEYGENFAKGYRNSTTLGTVREKEGTLFASLGTARHAGNLDYLIKRRPHRCLRNGKSETSQVPVAPTRQATPCS